MNTKKSSIVLELDSKTYIARSQARSITKGFEGCEHIVLDFKRVDMVGQGFVDEVFRVFQNQYPHIRIEYINANEDVNFMIKRSLS